MRNIRLDIEYDGTAYYGWQIQPNLPTVEEALSNALLNLTGEKVSMIVSGRTDTGVHARQQVLNFRTNSSLSLSTFKTGTNAYLPEDIAVQDAVEVPEEWHARFDAIQRHYRYRLLIGLPRSPLHSRYMAHFFSRPDVNLMSEAAQYFPGLHDFTSFRSVHCGAKNPVRELTHLSLSQEGRIITIDVKGNAFLRNMVRIIVGTLVKVGRGKIKPDEVKTILEKRDRLYAGATAPAHGLTLWAVKYPGEPDT